MNGNNMEFNVNDHKDRIEVTIHCMGSMLSPSIVEDLEELGYKCSRGVWTHRNNFKHRKIINEMVTTYNKLPNTWNDWN